MARKHEQPPDTGKTSRSLSTESRGSSNNTASNLFRYTRRSAVSHMVITMGALSGLSTIPRTTQGDADPDWLYAHAEGVHTDLPCELVIEHSSPGAVVTYEIEVEGTLESGEWPQNATIDGAVASGQVGPDRGLDNVYFDGAIVRFDVEHAEHARFYLADPLTREILEEIDPESITNRQNNPDHPGEAPEEYQEFVVGRTAADELAYSGHAEYVDEGYLRVWIEDHSTLENILFDFTAHDRARIHIITSEERRSGPFRGATDWTISNIGFRGMPRETPPIYPLNVAVTDPNGEGIIENVFADFRGNEAGGNNGSGFAGSIINSFESHEGTIINRHNFFAGPGGNGAYMEQDRQTGTVHWDHCYYRDASSTLYRTGLGDSEVRNCIAVRNDPNGHRGPYFVGGDTVGIGRAFWNRGGRDSGADPLLDNLQIYNSPDDLSISQPIWTNTQDGSPNNTNVKYVTINEEWVAHQSPGDPVDALVNDSGGGTTTIHEYDVQEPDVTILGEGVPFTPEMAAAGGRGYPPDPFGPSPDGGVDGALPEQPWAGTDAEHAPLITCGNSDRIDPLGSIHVDTAYPDPPDQRDAADEPGHTPDDADDTDVQSAGTSDEPSGVGFIGAITSLGGAAYLLKRRWRKESN